MKIFDNLLTRGRFGGALDAFGSRTLLVLVASLFVLDLFIPDPFPFVDEIVLGTLTILLARWSTRRSEPANAAKPPPKNVTPPR